jgi:hypothetical protein
MLVKEKDLQYFNCNAWILKYPINRIYECW